VLASSTEKVPPGLLYSLSSSTCFSFVTSPVRRGAEHALPAAAVVVLERCHSRCSLLRAVDAAVVPSDLLRAFIAKAPSDLASCIRVDAIAATIV